MKLREISKDFIYGVNEDGKIIIWQIDENGLEKMSQEWKNFYGFGTKE